MYIAKDKRQRLPPALTSVNAIPAISALHHLYSVRVTRIEAERTRYATKLVVRRAGTLLRLENNPQSFWHQKPRQ